MLGFGYALPDMGLLTLYLLAVVLLVLMGTWHLLHTLTYPPRLSPGVALARGFPLDPEDLNLGPNHPAQTLVLRDIDGQEMPGWKIRGADPEGPIAVLTHGFGDGRLRTLGRVPLFLPYVRAAVVYDMRAHGQSTAARSFCGLREPEDLLHLLKQLEPDDLTAGIVLVGFSIGGGISIVAASEAAASSLGGLVRGVIAEGPYRLWDEPVRAVLRNRRLPRQPYLWLVSLWLRLRLRGFGSFDRARWAAVLPCPLLVLHGLRDPICPPQAGQALAAAAPEGRLVTFENGAHLNLADVEPDRYRSALADFFTRIRATPPHSVDPCLEL